LNQKYWETFRGFCFFTLILNTFANFINKISKILYQKLAGGGKQDPCSYPMFSFSFKFSFWVIFLPVNEFFFQKKKGNVFLIAIFFEKKLPNYHQILHQSLDGSQSIKG
jgi:hypothetical protein